MAHVAFIVSVPEYRQADLGTYNFIGEQVAQLIAKDVPQDTGVRYVSCTKSDHTLQAVTVDSLVNPASTNVSTGSCAGPNTTTGTVTGILTTSVLLSALLVDDTTHAVTNVLSHVTITGANQITTDADESAGHIVLTWYNPAATVLAPAV